MTVTLGKYTRDTAFWIVRHLAHAGIQAEMSRDEDNYRVWIAPEDKKRAERLV